MEWKFRKDFEVMPGILLRYGNTSLQTNIIYPYDEITYEKEKLKHHLFKPYHVNDEIKSASIDQLTSNELVEFKQILFKSDKVFSETKILYGQLHFKSNTGLNEVYCFSNYELAMIFQKALYDYIDAIQKASSLLNAFK